MDTEKLYEIRDYIKESFAKPYGLFVIFDMTPADVRLPDFQDRLKKNYRALVSRYFPDHYKNIDHIIATEITAYLNATYDMLSHDGNRGDYLRQYAGTPFDASLFTKPDMSVEASTLQKTSTFDAVSWLHGHIRPEDYGFSKGVYEQTWQGLVQNFRDMHNGRNPSEKECWKMLIESFLEHNVGDLLMTQLYIKMSNALETESRRERARKAYTRFENNS